MTPPGWMMPRGRRSDLVGARVTRWVRQPVDLSVTRAVSRWAITTKIRSLGRQYP